MKYIFLISFLFLFNQPGKAQEIDYFNYSYKHLDCSYNIHIESATFNSILAEYGFYPDKIRDYDDSLALVMMGEFGDWKIANSATFRIGYTWLRLSYHTWLSIPELIALGKAIDIYHPYLLKNYIINNPEQEIVSTQLDILAAKLNEANLTDYPRDDVKKMLTYAMVNSPDRIKDYSRIYLSEKRNNSTLSKKFNNGKGCTKKNCCQKRFSNSHNE